MNPPRPVPCGLVDPLTKAPLVRTGDRLRGLRCEFRIMTIPGARPEIVDFHPRATIDHGAYDDRAGQFDWQAVRPSGQPHRPSYKSMALKHLLPHLPGEGVAIDLGCSNCEVSHFLPDSLVKVGVDISAAGLFKRRPSALDGNVDQLWICDATCLPAPDASADLVLCCDILEHLLRPQALLAEARRVLKPDGILFVSVPNLVSLGNRLSILAGSGVGLELAQLLKGKSPVAPVSGPRFPDQAIHLRWFTANSLSMFLIDNHFQPIIRFGIGPVATRLGLGRIGANSSLLVGMVARAAP